MAKGKNGSGIPAQKVKHRSNKSSPSELQTPNHPILKFAVKKPENQMTAFEKIALVRLGVSKMDLVNLKETAALDYDQLSHALSVARATLLNKKGKEKFNSSLSEKIIDLAGIYSYGYEVFEDEEKFNNWIMQPNATIDGQRPFELLDTQFGREAVKNLIGRIDYGVYS